MWDSTVIEPEFYSVEIADFTGDGRDDIATIVGGASPEHVHLLYVLPQLSSGELGPAIPYPLNSYEGGPYYNFPFAITRADLNQDGISDLVLTRGRSISLLTADGTGSFRSQTYSADRYFPLPAVVLDVNRDGLQDVVAFTTLVPPERGDPRNGFVVHYGDGRGGIAGHSEFRTSGTVPNDSEQGYSLATGDLNSDGYPDLVARISEFDFNAQIWRHVVSIHLHDKHQSFLPAIKINAVLTTGIELLMFDDVVVADLTRDGLDDLVVTAESHLRQEVHVLPQNPDGSIDGAAHIKSIQPNPSAVDIGDLNGDGYLDLLVAHSNYGSVGYLLNGQNGLQDQAVRAIQTGGAGIGRNSQAIGDLNGDGCNDAVVVAQWSSMAVLHGMGCTTRTRVTGGNAPSRVATGSERSAASAGAFLVPAPGALHRSVPQLRGSSRDWHH
jgi:hypothetical protein